MKTLAREKDIFHQTEFFNIQEDSAKLRTYSKIKTDIGLEEYLTQVRNTSDRIAMSRLRLSSHNLMIEVKIEENCERKQEMPILS